MPIPRTVQNRCRRADGILPGAVDCCTVVRRGRIGRYHYSRLFYIPMYQLKLRDKVKKVDYSITY